MPFITSYVGRLKALSPALHNAGNPHPL